MRLQYISYQYFPAVGGSEFSLQDLLRSARARGCQVQALVDNRRRKQRSFESVPFREIDGWEHIGPSIERFRPDVILTHLNWQAVAIEEARRRRIPVVHMSRICDANPAADLLVFNSNYVRSKWRQAIPFIDSYSAVLTPTILPDRWCKPVQPGPCILCSNPVREKGGELLRAIAQRLPEEKFVAPMAWEPPEADEFGLKSCPNISLQPPRHGLRTFLRQSWLAICPSLWQEPFGRVVLEAMSAGLPVIASKVGGLPEAMAEAGFLVEDYPNPDKWVEVIRTLRQNPELYSKHRTLALARAGRYWQECDPTELFDRLEKLVAEYQGPNAYDGFSYEMLESIRTKIAGLAPQDEHSHEIEPKPA